MAGPTPHSDGNSGVTRLIEAAGAGDKPASERLFELVYDQLRAIAGRRMAEEKPGHTLTATALVHEAYLRLIGTDEMQWASRVGFYHAAAEVMRHILIDHARRRGAVKRGGGRRPIDLLGVLDLATADDPEEIMAFDRAFVRLQEQAPEAAAVVRLRFFAGLGHEEAAKALGISERSVRREWAFAKAWLFRELGGSTGA